MPDGATAASIIEQRPAEKRLWLVRHSAEWRQVGIITVYMGLLAGGYALPWMQNPLTFCLACYFSFLNAVVIHNHLHKGIFYSRRLNMFWRCILSFGNLYPATANVSAHNLVHHQFEDDGQVDWVNPEQVRFPINLFNLLHFPNIGGPATFSGVGRWMAVTKQRKFVRQYFFENIFAFGLTLTLLYLDFWSALAFVVAPQLYGARCILRINLIQHDGTDIESDWNHSRNFVGKGFNWIMCNNGYHTIHHNRAGLHWSELDKAHEREVKAHIDPRLNERSMIQYLWRTYFVSWRRPAGVSGDVAGIQHVAPELHSRQERTEMAELSALEEVQ